MKKSLALLITLIVSIAMFIPATLAADTVLPQAGEDCETLLQDWDQKSMEDQKSEFATTENREELMGCLIKNGDMHLWMLPYYVTHIIEFLIGLAGLISVLFVIIGGYYYAWGGLTEDKEKGKKAVMYALIGLGLSTLAWIIVSIIQTQLTS